MDNSFNYENFNKSIDNPIKIENPNKSYIETIKSSNSKIESNCYLGHK